MKIECILSRSRKRIIFFNFSIVSFFSVLLFSHWWPISIQKMGGGHNFIDTNAVLRSAECAKNTAQTVSSVSTNCNYQYGSTLLKIINLVNIRPEHTHLIGYTFMCVVLLMTGILGSLYLNTRRTWFYSYLVSVSTASWLLIERGNFDVLIIALLGLAILIIGGRLAPLGIVLLGLSALIKFYTYPLLFLFALLTRNKYLRLFSIAIALLVLPMIIIDLTHLQGIANPTFVAFGLPLPGYWINFILDQLGVEFYFSVLWSYVLGICVVLLTWRLTRLFLSDSLPLLNIFQDATKSRVNLIFLFFSSAYVICFLSGVNYDYRLIYLSFSLLLLNYIQPKLLNTVLIYLSLSSLYFTYFFFGFNGYITLIFALMGNISQTVLAVYLFRIILVSIFSHLNYKRFDTLLSRI